MAIERTPIDPHLVICDSCSKDWSDSDQSGGVLFGSKAYCPECTPQLLKDITKYGERRFISGYCPSNQSYTDWVREMRGPNPGFTIYSGDDFKKAFEEANERQPFTPRKHDKLFPMDE